MLLFTINISGHELGRRSHPENKQSSNNFSALTIPKNNYGYLKKYHSSNRLIPLCSKGFCELGILTDDQVNRIAAMRIFI